MVKHIACTLAKVKHIACTLAMVKHIACTLVMKVKLNTFFVSRVSPLCLCLISFRYSHALFYRRMLTRRGESGHYGFTYLCLYTISRNLRYSPTNELYPIPVEISIFFFDTHVSYQNMHMAYSIYPIFF